ncbi:MAG: citrate/2-methylcitrate synthase [Spirochaetota bacterium]
MRNEEITRIIVDARDRARSETSSEPEPGLTSAIEWPVKCSVGPGLEGAIACESKVGYVNGSKGWLIYRGYDIFDLCAHSSYEEVSYLLLHGRLPSAEQLQRYRDALYSRLFIPETQRLLLSFPIQEMNPMAALRLGTNLMRQKQTYRDRRELIDAGEAIASDEDSIAMETTPAGERRSIYEFVRGPITEDEAAGPDTLVASEELASCYNLIAGIVSVATTVGRVRAGRLPIEPLPDLSLAGNYLYMLSGRRPSALEERIMDVCFILHADHGMNASTFASMVVASTLSDIYLAIGAGVSALAGPLHGGANVEVVKMLAEIGGPAEVDAWYESARRAKRKITGFGHRVYKAYDPRARILGPLAKLLIERSASAGTLYATARALEEKVVSTLGESKGVFPNVDFYSGLVYRSMGIPDELYTTIFAVSRVSGWTSRVVEYLQNNRIFRPRAIYTGTFNEKYVPLSDR